MCVDTIRNENRNLRTYWIAIKNNEGQRETRLTTKDKVGKKKLTGGK